MNISQNTTINFRDKQGKKGMNKKVPPEGQLGEAPASAHPHFLLCKAFGRQLINDRNVHGNKLIASPQSKRQSNLLDYLHESILLLLILDRFSLALLEIPGRIHCMRTKEKDLSEN